MIKIEIPFETLTRNELHLLRNLVLELRVPVKDAPAYLELVYKLEKLIEKMRPLAETNVEPIEEQET